MSPLDIAEAVKLPRASSTRNDDHVCPRSTLVQPERVGTIIWRARTGRPRFRRSSHRTFALNMKRNPPRPSRTRKTLSGSRVEHGILLLSDHPFAAPAATSQDQVMKHPDGGNERKGPQGGCAV